MHTIRELTPIERKQQLNTYVDFFVKEFISEIWYIEESARGNLPGRSEASMGTLVNIVCGILNLAPIPGAALGFLASYKLIEGAAKLVEGLDKPLSEYAAGVASAFVDNVREISDTDGDVAEVRGPGRDAAVDDGKPIDTESMAVLARWLGHQLAQRYEFLLTERLSTKPEEAIIGLARIGARRSLAFLSEHGGMKGTPEERAEKLLSGVVYGKSTSWSKRKLKWFSKQERLIGRDEVRHETFYAEKAYVTGAWYPCAGEYPKTDPGKVEWLKKPFSNQPKYGYIRGSYEKANSTLYGSYAAPLEPWLPQRYYQPITKAQIMAYLTCPEVVNAKAEQRTATTSLHQFLAAQPDSKFPDYGRAVFRGDLTNVNLSSGNFSEAGLSGSRIGGDLSHCCFDSAQLFTAHFIAITSSVGSVVSFTKAEMGFSDLSYANMQGEVDFTQTDLSCTNLTAAKFGAIQHVGTQWYKAVLKDVEYEAIVKEQHEQLSDVVTKQAAQARELAVLNDKIAGLAERAQPLFDQLEASLQPPAAGAGAGTSGRSTPDLVTSDQREELEALLSCQEKRLQFEAYAQAKLLSSCGRENPAQEASLKTELERVQAQRDAAEAELQGQLAALNARVERLEASVVVAGTRFTDLAQQLSELKKTIARQTGLHISESMSLEEREAIIAKSALRKVIAQYLKGLSHKQQDLHYYVRPDLITELPGNLTVGEYVAQVEQGKRDDASVALLDEVKGFLNSSDNVLLLLGEAGAGKSLFAWYCTQMRLKQYQEILRATAHGEAEWLPLVIELKNYCLSEIKGVLPRYLQSVCELEAEELKAIQGGSRSTQKLLVILDGFDELKQPSAGEPDNSKLFADCLQTIGGGDWFESQIKVVVTCRVRQLPDRSLERQYFGYGEGQHYRRRILLPFNSTKIAAYLEERAALPVTSEAGALSVEDYQAVLAESDSVKEMVRNPFVLRLFVEALPSLNKHELSVKSISRFDVYKGFVTQWFERNVNKLDETTKLALGMDEYRVEKVAESFAHYAAILANEMYRRNSLVVGLSDVKSDHEAFKVWSGLERQVLSEIKKLATAQLVDRYNALSVFDIDDLREEGVSSADEYVRANFDDACRQSKQDHRVGLKAFKKTGPLRQTGEYYSFIHKSFYEYFIAVGIIQSAASDKTKDERVADTLEMLGGLPEYAVRRLWQEPEALDFVCEYWVQASSADKDRLKETWFAVIEATKGHPERGDAGGNAVTLLNWVNVSMTYKHWQGVQIPGADLRNAYLEGSDLSGADLSGAWLGRMQADQVNLRGGILTGVKFCQRPAISLNGTCGAIAFHPTKNRVALAEGRRIRQYDFTENLWIEPQLRGHIQEITSVTYSADGLWLASGSWDKTIRQWAASSGEMRGAPLKGHTGAVTSVCYSGDGKWLASGSNDSTVRQWATTSGELRGAPLEGHTDRVTSVSYSGDDQWLVSGSWDRTIRQWAAESGEMRGAPLEGHSDAVTSVCYSGDGKWLASGSNDSTIRQWATTSGEMRGAPLVGHTGPIRCVSYSGDGKWLASGSNDRTICQWAAASGELRGAPLEGHTDGVTSVSYSVDGNWLASGSYDRTIRQWEAVIGEARGAPLAGHTDRVTSVRFSADGKWLASGSKDRTIRQWVGSSGELRGAPLVGHTDRVTSLCYSADGQWLASGSWDKTIRQWDAASGELRGAPLVGHTGAVTSVSYSVDGKWLASGSYDRTIRQWAALSGEMRGVPLEGYTETVNGVSYSQDGKWLASSSGDGTVRVWRQGIKSGDGCVSDEDERAGVWWLAWGSKSILMQLSAKGMRLAGATGLEPHQLELLRQHGYKNEENRESDDNSDAALAAGVEESKAVPPEETEVEHGLGAGQQLVRVGLFPEPPQSGGATSGGVEEAKETDSCAELSGQSSSAGVGR